MGDCDGEPKPVRRTDDPNPHPGGGRRRRKSRRGGCRRREDNEAVRIEDREWKIEDHSTRSILDPRSECVWFFQSLLREHILFQPRVEANVLERQDRLSAFGGCAHLYPLCDPDAGDFFEVAGFQNPLFQALFVVHLGQNGIRRIFRDPDVDVSVLGSVRRHGARLDLVGLAPVNHFAIANELVSEIVEHALRQVLVGEIRADEALSAFLRGEAADASNRWRVHPLTVSHAALVDRKQTYATHLRRIGKSHKSLAIAQPAEFAHSELLAPYSPILVYCIYLSSPGRVAAGVLLVNALHDFSGVLRPACASKRQHAKDRK